jgi:hypothetical protein
VVVSAGWEDYGSLVILLVSVGPTSGGGGSFCRLSCGWSHWGGHIAIGQVPEKGNSLVVHNTPEWVGPVSVRVASGQGLWTPRRRTFHQLPHSHVILLENCVAYAN